MFNFLGKKQNNEIKTQVLKEDHFDRFKVIFQILLDNKNFVDKDLRYISLISKNNFASVVEMTPNTIIIKFMSPELSKLIGETQMFTDDDNIKLFKYLEEAKNEAGKEIYTSITISNGLKYLVVRYLQNTSDFEFYFISPEDYNSHLKQIITRDINIINQIVGMKDNDTLEHTLRVGELSSYLASLLGKDKDYCEKIKIAAQLHDIGKIRIPDSILLKKTPLDKDEYDIMKLHTIYGAEMVDKLSFIFSGIDALDLIKNIVLYHHEKYDGTGYNDGLSGDEIPLESKIVNIIDSFDSIKTDNVEDITYEEIKEVMQKLRGVDFDPKILDIFLEHYYEFVGIRGLYDDNSIEKIN
ncbi:MAG: HD domain-containing protein [Candidatus Gracilibacteria bacterium]|nr:HD domain-containing protein [Candidatus Gracilibacteria bacterium]